MNNLPPDDIPIVFVQHEIIAKRSEAGLFSAKCKCGWESGEQEGETSVKEVTGHICDAINKLRRQEKPPPELTDGK